MIQLSVNGERYELDVPADMPLLWVVRDVLGLTGTKFGCGIAQCGACTVHLDGEAVRSCVLPVGALAGRAVTTIEAVGESALGSQVQQAWLERERAQVVYERQRAEDEREHCIAASSSWRSLIQQIASKLGIYCRRSHTRT